MHWLFQLSFLALHLLVYIVILRHLPVFQRERGIFAFHSIPFFALLIAAIIGWSLNTFGITTIAGMLSLQLIYSMSFLEVWSLAEGSYSLQILLQVAQHPTKHKSAVIAATSSIGARKKQNRLRSLMEMGLACETHRNEVRLTSRGRLVTAFFRAIKFLANIKAAG
jgi:hypothetical protein